ncbi:MAG: GtrA family protein [Saprospiraceae bacterium]|nr:GtrA family protein [Saprospiraceae bacterium]
MTDLESTSWWRKLLNWALPKAKYAAAGAVATGVDYTVYLLLVNKVLAPVPSNVVAYSAGMIVNFFLQKRFVFQLRRSVGKAFFFAALVSLGGMFLSSVIIYGLSLQPFFNHHQAVTKLIATGLVFFYNFYLKRYVFEGRFAG